MSPSNTISKSDLRYKFNDDVKNPVEVFIHQRSVSSDRLAHGRPEIPEMRKGR